MSNTNSERIYLDYAATTPPDPRVLEAMKPFQGEIFGNPSSLHYYGQKAKAAVDQAREYIAKTIGAEFGELIFTGSATEANNLALQGIIEGVRRHESWVKKPRFVISSVEHESVLEVARKFEKEGVEVLYIPVDQKGFLDVHAVHEALTPETVLLSVLYVQNEIGTVEPIREIAEIVKNYRSSSHVHSPYPVFHTDAAQAFPLFSCDVRELGADMMTLSAHKIYGRKGRGALYVREEIKKRLTPLMLGGGQEFDFRSGTENVSGIMGFKEAVRIALGMSEREKARLKELRSYFWKKLKEEYPELELNGGEQGSPHILNIYFPNHKAEELLTYLDLKGIAASSGSACSAHAMAPSHVIRALGYDEKRSRRSIRFSFGRFTTREEIDEVLHVMHQILSEIRI